MRQQENKKKKRKLHEFIIGTKLHQHSINIEPQSFFFIDSFDRENSSILKYTFQIYYDVTM